MTAAIAAAAALTLLPALGIAQASAMEIDLSKMAPGGAPPDFESARTGQGGPAQWVVVADETASQGRAIAQTSTDRTDYRFPLAIYQPATEKDVEVVVRFKPVAGKVDQAGGIAVRLASPDDYYVARANALEDNVRFYRVVKGSRQQIAGANTKVSSGEWHTLGLRAEGDRFSVSFDGKPLIAATDATFREAGKIALWTKADSVTYFDRIAIRRLP
ncbi:MAG TPA: hypothetical protein VF502_01135 [Stellaceae bacterium]